MCTPWLESERHSGVDMIFCVQASDATMYSRRDAAFYLTNENGRYILRGRRLHHDVWLDCCLPDYDEYEMSFEGLPLDDCNTRATKTSDEFGERVVEHITYRRVLRNLRATCMECKKYGSDEWWETRKTGDMGWLEALTGLGEDVRLCSTKYCWKIICDGEHCPAHTYQTTES